MDEEQLARVPLFAELSHRELTWLADACRERTYLPGEELLHEGSGRGVGLYLLLAGRVRLRTAEGAAHELGAGAILGEAALLEEAPSVVTVRVLEPTRALVLPLWDFRATLRENPDLAVHLLAVLGRRLRLLDQAGRASEGRA